MYTFKAEYVHCRETILANHNVSRGIQGDFRGSVACRVISSSCDYFLGSDRCFVRNVQIREPHLHGSDHFAVVAVMALERPGGSNAMEESSPRVVITFWARIGALFAMCRFGNLAFMAATTSR